jgi:23S rRNA pseudouridine2605 synthase
VTELGTRANPHRDRIVIDGKLLRAAPPPVYLLLNKPVGVMTTLIDPGGRPTVRDLLGGRISQRVFPVGRLDFHSAGLLLLTNDGELALRLTHPRYGVHKTYEVKVKGRPEGTQLAALARGVKLPDGTSAPATVRVLESSERKTWLSITLSEGKNRQVRRMCDAVGLPVEKLIRVALGPLELGKLPPGAWRHLEPQELGALRAAAVPRGRHEGPPAPPRRTRERHRRTAEHAAGPRRRSAPQTEAAPGASRGSGRGGRNQPRTPRPRRRAGSQ